MAIAALLAGGVLTLVSPWPDGWAFGPLLGVLLGALPDVVGRALGLGALAIAAIAAVRGWRMAPRSSAYFVAALGAGALGGVILGMGASAGQSLTWAAALQRRRPARRRNRAAICSRSDHSGTGLRRTPGGKNLGWLP